MPEGDLVRHRAELSGAPEEFDKISGTAKLERKKQATPGGEAGGKAFDADEVQTAELRERMKLTPKAEAAAPATDGGGGESDTQDLQPAPKPGTERVVKRKSLTLDGGSMTLKPATNADRLEACRARSRWWAWARKRRSRRRSCCCTRRIRRAGVKRIPPI
jgi:hypothetical protein